MGWHKLVVSINCLITDSISSKSKSCAEFHDFVVLNFNVVLKRFSDEGWGWEGGNGRNLSYYGLQRQNLSNITAKLPLRVRFDRIFLLSTLSWRYSKNGIIILVFVIERFHFCRSSWAIDVLFIFNKLYDSVPYRRTFDKLRNIFLLVKYRTWN